MLAGCQTFAQQIGDQENQLTAAGFKRFPADTPERLMSLRQLPANQFVATPEGSGTGYVYADPVVCGCLYVGDNAAYDAYQNSLLQTELWDQRELDNLMYAGDFGWDDWDGRYWGNSGLRGN